MPHERGAEPGAAAAVGKRTRTQARTHTHGEKEVQVGHWEKLQTHQMPEEEGWVDSLVHGDIHVQNTHSGTSTSGHLY